MLKIIFFRRAKELDLDATWPGLCPKLYGIRLWGYDSPGCMVDTVLAWGCLALAQDVDSNIVAQGYGLKRDMLKL